MGGHGEAGPRPDEPSGAERSSESVNGVAGGGRAGRVKARIRAGWAGAWEFGEDRGQERDGTGWLTGEDGAGSYYEARPQGQRPFLLQDSPFCRKAPYFPCKMNAFIQMGMDWPSQRIRIARETLELEPMFSVLTCILLTLASRLYCCHSHIM